MTKYRTIDKVALTLILLVIILYCAIILKYTSFMPVMDDYDTVLDFLHQFLHNSISDNFTLLFQQHGDHRIAFNRIIHLLQYYIDNEVNFIHLTIFGNLGLFILLYIIWRYFKRYVNSSIFLFAPVAIVMLNFSQSALTTWAMTSIQQYWQLLFATLSIYYMVSNKYILTYIFFIFAVFTGGGGFALIPIFILYAILEKKWKFLLQSIVIIIIIAGIYFYLLHFERSTRSTNPIELLKYALPSYIEYIFNFLGNWGRKSPISLYIGIISIILFIFNIKYFLKKLPFIGWLIIFIIVTASLAGLSRAGAGAEQALSSRYAIYSLLLTSLIYIGYISRYNFNIKLIYIGYIISIFAYIYHFIVSIPEFERRYYQAQNGLLFPSVGHAEARLKKAKEDKIFFGIDKITLPSKIKKLPTINGDINYTIEINNNILTNKSNVHTLKIIDTTKPIEIKGFAYDKKANANICAVVVSLDKYSQTFYPRYSSKFNSKNLKFTKLDIAFKLDNLEQGKNYNLSIKFVNHECKAYAKIIDINTEIANLNSVPIDINRNLHTRVNVESIKNRKNMISIEGWYVVNNYPSTNYTVVIEIDSKRFLAKSRILRPDVKDYFNDDRYLKSGFKFNYKFKNLKSAHHNIKIYLLDKRTKKLIPTNKIYHLNVNNN